MSEDNMQRKISVFGRMQMAVGLLFLVLSCATSGAPTPSDPMLSAIARKEYYPPPPSPKYRAYCHRSETDGLYCFKHQSECLQALGIPEPDGEQCEWRDCRHLIRAERANTGIFLPYEACVDIEVQHEDR